MSKGRKQVRRAPKSDAGESIKRIEGRMNALEAGHNEAMAHIQNLTRRLFKAETALGTVAKGEMPPNVERDLARDVTCSDYPQRPETE